MTESQRNNAESQRTPDREKVIRHFQDAITASGAGNRWRFVRDDIIEDAIALLREMGPVEPIKKPGIVEPYKCGVCGAVLGWESEKQRFCPNCGRGIRWNA